MLPQITPLILTFNEAANLRRTLGALAWAREIVVVDSFSSDETEQIAQSASNVAFLRRRFDSHAAQWNFGVDQVKTEWVLALDADYVVTSDLRDEIAQLQAEDETAAYFARFRYCVDGRPLRGSLYPPRAVLFQKSKCRFVQDGHTQILKFDGPSTFLKGVLLHDDRKSLTRWLISQQRYAKLEAEKLIECHGHRGSLPDRLRRLIWPAAPAAFVYTMLVKGCLFDGWPGWFYAMQRAYAELLLSLELLDRKLAGKEKAIDAALAPRTDEPQMKSQSEARLSINARLQ